MIQIEADTATELYKKVLWNFVLDGEGLGPSHNSLYNADSGRAWVTDGNFFIRNPLGEQFNLIHSGYIFPNRWAKFWTEYTQQGEMQQFLEDCRMRQPFEEIGYTCPVRANHKLGNCLHAINFRSAGMGQKAQVTLMSRSSLFAPTAVLDLGFGLAIARWIVENTRQRIKPDDISLLWQCSQVQVMSWKMLLPLRMFGLIKMEDDLPDTRMGNLLRSHLQNSRRGRLPTLRMFARQGIKYLEFEESGRFDNPPFFPSTVPEAYDPNSQIKIREGEHIDYEIDAQDWMIDRDF